MNKMHEAAKIAFAVLGIYFLVGLLGSLCSILAMIFSNFSGAALITAFVYLTILFGCAFAVVFLLFLKRDWLAAKFVSSGQEIDSDVSANWVLVAYRLAVFIVAIYFLKLIFWNVSSIIYNFILTRGFSSSSGRQIIDIFLRLMFTLPITIYMLCGAPHFVRWQIKKTTEFCKQLETETEN